MTCKVNFFTSCNLSRKDMHSHLIRIKSNFIQVSIITLITYFFSIKIQFAHKTPLNPRRDVNKKALHKTRNPVVCFVWYDQGPISNHFFLLSKSTFHRSVSAFRGYCNQSKNKKTAIVLPKLWPKQDPRECYHSQRTVCGDRQAKRKQE